MDLIPQRIPNFRKVEKRSISHFILYIMLLLPDDFYRVFAVYSSKTPGYISYKWLNYSFNVVLLMILVVGTMTAICNRDWLMLEIGGVIAFRECFFWLIGYDSCITNAAYEIYLTIFTGIAFLKLVEKSCCTKEELEIFFWRSILLNALTVFAAPILGKGIHEGMYSRFNAVNMDVGSTGTICALLVMFCCFNRTVSKRFWIAGLAVTALFLTGSRVNLLLLFVILTIAVGIRLLQKRKVSKKCIGVFVGGIVLATIVLLGTVMTNRQMLLNLNGGLGRMMTSFDLTKMGNDGSVIGRTASIYAGIDIIKKYPFGISGYFVNLQTETIRRGFPTFPHSTLLDYYIFLGPIIVVFIARVVICLRRLLASNQIAQFLALAYFLVFITLSGGPIINFKIIFFYALLFKVSLLKEDV